MGKRTCRYFALFNGVLGTDDQKVATALVASECGIGYKQRPSLVLQEWNTHASEVAGQELAVCVLKPRPHGERSGRGIDSGRCVVEHTFMRVSLIRLERNFDWQLALEVGRADAATSHVGTDTKDVLFVDAEVDVDRVELNDGRKQSGGGPTADQFRQATPGGR